MSHPSSFEFDRALLGERSAAFDAHLVECARCRDELGALQRAQESFAASAAPLEAARAVGTRLEAIKRRRWWWAAPVLAAVTAGALLLVVPPTDEGVRTKGEVGIDVFAQSPLGAVRRLGADERPRANDRVQLGFRAPGFARVSLFVLERGCEVAMLSGGWAVDQLDGLIPESWTVTGDGGRLYAVFSAEPITVPDFVEALRHTERGCEPALAPPLDGARFSARGVVLVPAEAP